MSAGKPARYIDKLTKQLELYKEAAKQDARVVEQLRAELAAAVAALARSAELDELRRNGLATISAERDRLREMIAQRTDHDRQTHAAMVGLLGEPRAWKLRMEPVYTVTQLLNEHDAQLAALRARIAELEARGPELDAKEAEIRAMVERVQERMRRDERDKANAILNRKALAGVVPGLRRR